MSKFCSNCGAQLDLEAKFCGSCGTSAEILVPIPEQTDKPMEPSQSSQTSVANAKNAAVQGLHSITQLSGGIIAAPTGAGEIVFDVQIPKIAGELIQVINPFKVLFSGAWNVIRGIGAAFKDKKKWIPALIMAVTWFVLTLLPNLGFNPNWIQGLSWLTFARGGLGMTENPELIHIVGGIVGKGIVASLIFSLFSGGNPLRKIGSGLKTMFSSYACKGIGQIGILMIGIGLALIFYNFMVGFASLSMSMAGISALLLSLKSLGSRTGFLQKFFGGLTAKKTAEGKSMDTPTVKRIIAGLATGFMLSVPLSAINIYNLPYILGGVVFISGIIIAIVGKPKKEAEPI
ncbi:MAG: zinc-ribbon domain-containing protein [Acetivibrionales bacterium]